MIFLALHRNTRLRMIYLALPPYHPPICAIQGTPKRDFRGANGGIEGGHRRIGMKEDRPEQSQTQ